MATQLNTTTYSQINDDMNELLTSGAYSGVNITIYNDAGQTSIVNDVEGPIQNRKIGQIGYVASHTSSTTGQIVPGSITINFTDGTVIVAVDGVNNYWYSLQGIIFQPRRFGGM
uniref:Uncharacterized protein n=1 Tax=viral metagenome TaxID=1070528 RepID=A0A6C0JG44_9ZZZZ